MQAALRVMMWVMLRAVRENINNSTEKVNCRVMWAICAGKTACFVTIRWPGRHAKSKVAGQLLTVVRVTTATATSEVRLTITAVKKQRI
jgi:hypothetical protein